MWRVERRSMGLFSEMRTILELFRIYKKIDPHIVHHITIKPILYGSLCALWAQVPEVINNFTGLGYLFSEAPKAVWLRRLLLPVFRWILKGHGFQQILLNKDDVERLVNLRAISRGEVKLIKGEGIDLDLYKPAEGQYQTKGAPIVLMASRLLWDKGVAEFIEVAQRINQQGRNAKFWIAGEADPGNPTSVPKEDIENW